jgi:hypothetical protein
VKVCLEKLTGSDFIFSNRTSSLAALQAYNLFFTEFLTRFLVQGNLHAAFPNASYDFASDSLIIGDTLDAVIANINALATTMDLNSFTNLAYYASNILKLN